MGAGRYLGAPAGPPPRIYPEFPEQVLLGTSLVPQQARVQTLRNLSLRCSFFPECPTKPGRFLEPSSCAGWNHGWSPCSVQMHLLVPPCFPQTSGCHATPRPLVATQERETLACFKGKPTPKELGQQAFRRSGPTAPRPNPVETQPTLKTAPWYMATTTCVIQLLNFEPIHRIRGWVRLNAWLEPKAWTARNPGAFSETP